MSVDDGAPIDWSGGDAPEWIDLVAHPVGHDCRDCRRERTEGPQTGRTPFQRLIARIRKIVPNADAIERAALARRAEEAAEERQAHIRARTTPDPTTIAYRPPEAVALSPERALWRAVRCKTPCLIRGCG